MASSCIPSRWKELSGEKNWEGLLNPIDPDLRRYLIHYCQRVAAAAASFNNIKASKGYSLNLYSAEQLFEKVGLVKGNPYHYQITRFIYAATSDEDVACFGYVAVATDEGKTHLGRRDILVTWRGTITKAEWEDDAKVVQTSAKDLFGSDSVQVHYGFHEIYTKPIGETSAPAKTSASQQVREAVQELVDKYQDEEVSITVAGHSLGAALATLNAMDIAYNGFNRPKSNPDKAFMVTAFPVASPRVGNLYFKNVCENLENFHLLRIVNRLDIVPKVPWLPDYYYHVGKELGIDSTESPDLKLTVSPHNLEVYEFGVAGYQEDGEFKVEVPFDTAVINKESDGLVDKFKIPAYWWTTRALENMVQEKNGNWKFMDPYRSNI